MKIDTTFSPLLALDENERINIILRDEGNSLNKAVKDRLNIELDAILTNAWLVKIVPSKQDNKNQRSFERILIMEYVCTGLGRVKMTVGVRRSDKMKVQYCITAINAGKIKQEA